MGFQKGEIPPLESHYQSFAAVHKHIANTPIVPPNTVPNIKLIIKSPL